MVYRRTNQNKNRVAIFKPSKNSKSDGASSHLLGEPKSRITPRKRLNSLARKPTGQERTYVSRSEGGRGGKRGAPDEEKKKKKITAAERRGRWIAPGSKTEERGGGRGADLGLCQQKKSGYGLMWRCAPRSFVQFKFIVYPNYNRFFFSFSFCGSTVPTFIYSKKNFYIAAKHHHHPQDHDEAKKSSNNKIRL